LSLCAILLAPSVHAEETAEKRSAFEAQFEEVWQLILREHIKPIEDTPQARMNCLFGMISDGLRGCLHDKYAFYYSPDEAKAFFSDMKGTVGGVGLKLERRGEYVRIKEIVPGSPAERSLKLVVGDAIVAVNDEDVRYDSAGYVASRIIGDTKTGVSITVKRLWEILPAIDLVREQFVVPSVVARTIGEVEVLKVSSFKLNTHLLFERAVLLAARRGTQKFVIDLRGNSGGSLDVALNIACFFSNDPRDVLVTTLGRSPEDINPEIAASCSEEKRGKLLGLKFVILVNEESASASEVLAALAKDWGFAKVVGVRTFGKGSVQRTFELPDGSFVQFTVAKYYVGNNFVEVDGVGVEPDIVARSWFGEQDAQLRVALDILNESGSKK
ncbi:MAG: PDZ domain-containing protein, partial [Candidatus Niyogibacteria bacterium]|nr:PDZ domain-containing protein [Candidatus Niyogibacteria bacterium]